MLVWLVTFGGFEPAFVDGEMNYVKKLEEHHHFHNFKVNITKVHLQPTIASIGGNEQHVVVMEPPADVDTIEPSWIVVCRSSPLTNDGNQFFERHGRKRQERTLATLGVICHGINSTVFLPCLLNWR